jgi:hypothetical protein
VEVEHQGHVEGTTAGLPFGKPDRNDEFTISGQDPMITREFDGILAGSRFDATIDGKDKLVGGVVGILGDLVEEAVAALGKAAATAVVSLVV